MDDSGRLRRVSTLQDSYVSLIISPQSKSSTSYCFLDDLGQKSKDYHSATLEIATSLLAEVKFWNISHMIHFWNHAAFYLNLPIS